LLYFAIGSGGQSVTLVSNYFPITTYTDWSLYQYRVDFNPVQDRINIQRGLLSTHKDVLGAYIFDGSMLFSSKKYQPDVSSRHKFHLYFKDNNNYIFILDFRADIKTKF